TGKLVVALRGVCARVDRAIFGQRHGAAAVALINNDPTFGVFEGNIFDPVTGNIVTIPLVGVRGNSQTALSADARALIAAASTTDASQLGGFQPKLGGSGLVQPFAATRTSVVARGTKDAGNVSFGVGEFSSDFSGEERIRVQNLGSSTQTFAASVIQGPSTTNPATSLN